ncbi:MAG TPA: MBL fold metallo-hydrolase [Terriglobales bacterium]|nr:MBL fold metallo-hydrolase [Terriglobales bacterium]
MSAELRAADRVDVLVIVDNSTDSLSTTPKHVTPEWAVLHAAGRLPFVAGETICRAHHGLSLLVTAHVGDERRTVLFDAGPEDATFRHNAGILAVDPGSIDAIVLSHGHWDHGGGLVAAVEAVAQARGRTVDCYVHPGMFVQRGSQRPDGSMYVFKPLAEPEALGKAGARVVVSRDRQLIADGLFAVSGEIPRTTPFETGLPGHVRRSAQGWEPDPLIMDERFLTVRLRDKGTLVFSACSHAGIVNVLAHAAETSSAPLYGVMGGFHLAGATEKIIPETVAGIERFAPKLLAPGHCTGWRALSLMARTFGDELIPTAVGKRYLL